MATKCILALEDGLIFEGLACGAPGESYGEVVFNTSMTGYQEVLTDPSYKGQFVTMTYPLIGNYGVNKEDVESRNPWVEGFIMKECSKVTSNWRAEKSLRDYLKENKIVAIEGIDTRALTKHLRDFGSKKAVMSTTDFDKKSLVKKAKNSPSIIGIDLVKEVTCKKKYSWSKKGKYKIVVLDCGIKYNSLRMLAQRGCKVEVVPASTTAEQILALKPDGMLLSNGPGDPEGVPYVIETVKKLIGKLPIFGICLGHQIIGLALGGKTYKLKFGHHGGNHPVRDLATGRVAITTQNHNFCLDVGSLKNRSAVVTHINLNDRTVEGMRHKKLPVFSVQYHPEAGPGPHDAGYLFDNFIKMIKES
jgi:carbamoyl-phosphate synthase small subunit